MHPAVEDTLSQSHAGKFSGGGKKEGRGERASCVERERERERTAGREKNAEEEKKKKKRKTERKRGVGNGEKQQERKRRRGVARVEEGGVRSALADGCDDMGAASSLLL